MTRRAKPLTLNSVIGLISGISGMLGFVALPEKHLFIRVFVGAGGFLILVAVVKEGFTKYIGGPLKELRDSIDQEKKDRKEGYRILEKEVNGQKRFCDGFTRRSLKK